MKYDRLGLVRGGGDDEEDLMELSKAAEQNRLWNADVAARYDTPGSGMLRPTC
ncbi:hypothetical protein ACWGID_23080 [Kribbella sp. NPDC054772]